MNQQGVKKLAEVEAFICLSEDIMKRAGKSFASYAPSVRRYLKKCRIDSLRQFIVEDNQEVFDAAQSRTTRKLMVMMDTYVGDKWDNPIEVMEWTSFVAGAGAAHCVLASSLLPEEEEQAIHQIDDLHEDFLCLLDAVIFSLAVPRVALAGQLDDSPATSDGKMRLTHPDLI